MRERFEIKINGVLRPAVITTGAMLRFSERTGRELDEMQGLGDWLLFLWCCLVSGGKREGTPFEMSFDDFTEAVTPWDIQAWVTELTGEGAILEDAGKKKGSAL